MRFFKNVRTLEELKKEYRTLATKHHPDRGGDLETMQAINSEYDEVFKRVKNLHTNAKGETYEKETQEQPNDFRDIIEVLLRMQGVHIEVIGSFIWLSGETKVYKDQIKELGFKWSSNKKMWYKSPEGYRRRTRKNHSIDEIRGMFGVQYEGNGQGYMRLQA